MKRCYFIGLDTHGQFCEMAAVDQGGKLKERGRCDTTIPDLVELLERVPKPRRLVIEEGPLADWLWRNLRTHVEEMIVCEPRRNRLIAEDGDKDDPVDAEKLAQLYRGGYIKPVHHTESLAQAIFKQHVTLYHQRVSQRVGEGHRIRCLLRRHDCQLDLQSLGSRFAIDSQSIRKAAGSCRLQRFDASLHRSG